LGDSPPEIIIGDIKNLAHKEYYSYSDELSEEDIKKDHDALFPKGVIHHLSRESYVWNFSLVYREGNFDVIKWKTSFAWKEWDKVEENQEVIMEKGLFIGALAGIFFLMIDDNIYDNFNQLADMMDVFIDKTKNSAPFLVYGIIENKQKIAELKTNKDLLKNLGDVKKWTSQHGGDFKLENLNEIRMNLPYLITDYSHYILTKLKTKTLYSNLKLGEVHYLDFEDLSTLKEIEQSLAEQATAGKTADHLLSELFFKYLKMPEFQEEIYEHPVELTKEEVPLGKPTTPSKIKIILEEIRKGIRRQCPKCFNYDRNKIREAIDRENIIMQNPNIYGWKYICGECGNEWRTERDTVEYEIEKNKES